MPQQMLAYLDRRVVVEEGPTDAKAGIQFVSQLREWPYVVLLGEPGMGKTTVFKQEAAIDGAVVMSVRDLINGGQPQPDVPLYLDALDEYRSDGDAKDKADRLANALAQAKPRAWRLSCRSEDWREGTDLRRLERVAGEGRIVVVSLEPLSLGEAARVLRALGASDPDVFLEEADRYAAGAFLENPLSLRLLHAVVCSGGAWPTTRFDLFERAINSLAFEHDPERSRDRRHAAATIVDAASKACLLLLLSNANGIWRSHGPPPSGAGGSGLVTAHDLELELTLLGDMLDTALFRGDGDAFQPMHRAMAENLAGRALAAAICGAGGQPRFPLRRAMAMIAGGDGRAPSELRGLYAWIAAHLARLGNHEDARRLIESDAITVLAYGDAAVFTTSCRQAILHNLDRHDPYFRAADSGDTMIGSLAGNDLAPDFQQILSDRTDQTHRFITVTEALTYGSPVPAVRPLLWEIARDPSRPDWQRWRAAEAWAASAADKGAAQRQLFDALADEPVSSSREALRIYLAAKLPATHLSVDDFKQVFSDYAKLPREDVAGRLTSLQLRLEAEPQPALFDTPLQEWLPRKAHSPVARMEIDHVLERVLAQAIEQTGDLSAARLWAWLTNVDECRFDNPDEAVAKAIQVWLDAKPERGGELFEAIVASQQPDDGPWFPRLLYVTKSGRLPPTSVVCSLLESADQQADEADRLRYLAIAVEVARESESAGYWDAYAYLDGRKDCEALFDRLRICDEEHRRTWARHAAKQRARELEEKAKNREFVSAHVKELPEGRPLTALEWAAHLYFGKEASPADFGRLIDATSPELAQAIEFGWRHLMAQPGFDVAELGAAAGRGGVYRAESAAIAGLARMMEQGAVPEEPTLPICLALVVLKSAHVFADPSGRERLERWAVGRIESANREGTQALTAFWEASLAAGEALSLCGVWRLAELAPPNGNVAHSLAALLSSRNRMPHKALHSALVAACRLLNPDRLLQLAHRALRDTDASGEQRLLWSCVAFGIDPIGEVDCICAENPDELEPFFGDSAGGALIRCLGTLSPAARIHREAMTVRLFGSRANPEAMLSPRNDPVRGAIAWLERCPDPEADAALLSLIRAPGLALWRNTLRHALATKVKARHDQAFRHPPVSAIRAALAGGAPVSAADLMAVVVDQLRQIQAEMQLDPLLPWQAYWSEKPKSPKVENSCRNIVAQQLQARLRPFGIVVPPMPEAQRAAETRADVLILNGAGVGLPIEAKRHFHPEVWIAAGTQLQGYTADVGAAGFGIYLVFWFGTSWKPTPARGKRRQKPSTAAEMEAMLREDLPEELHVTTEVIVLDVSDPGVPTCHARKRTSSTSTGRATSQRKGQGATDPQPAPSSTDRGELRQGTKTSRVQRRRGSAARG